MKPIFLNLLTLLILTAVNAQAATYYVATTGNDANPGSQAQPFQTIQRGLNVAAHGDTVLVANGTYTGAGNKNLIFGGKALTLQSQGGADTCIVDCENEGRGFNFHGGETAQAVLDGFTVRRGRMITGSFGENFGGALSIVGSSPAIRNCVFADSAVVAGANQIRTGAGGAWVSNSQSVFTNCRFLRNTATGKDAYGGGIYVYESSITFTRCVFSYNQVVGGEGGDTSGGGLQVSGRDSSAILSECILIGNTVQSNGNGNAFGGGLESAGVGDSFLRMTNCLIAGNSISAGHRSGGGGMSLRGRFVVGQILHCTFAGNGGSGLYADGHDNSRMTNSISYENQGPSADGFLGIVRMTFVHCNLQGRAGYMDSPPRFLSLVRGDYRLNPESPCRDAGTLAITPPSTDLAGNPRIVGTAPDLGCYEFPLPPLALCVDGVAGNDVSGDGSPNAPFKTVTRALNVAVSNAVIFVKSGHYGSDRPRVTKRVQFLNWGSAGQARIGQP